MEREFTKQILQQFEFIEQYYMIDPWTSLPDWNKPFNVDPKMFDNICVEAMREKAFASEKTVVL